MEPSARPIVTGIGLIAAAVLPGFMAAAVAVEMRAEFPLGNRELGLAAGISYVVGTLGSAPAGRWIDRIGPVRGARLSAGASAGALLGVAALADSAAALIGLLVLAGVAIALAAPAASALASRGLRHARQGFGLGVQQAGAPAGALLSGLALPLIAVPIGWRWAFAAGAVVPLAAGCAVRDAGRPTDAARPAAPLEGAPLQGVRLLGAAAALANAAACGMVAFLVVFAVDVGLSPVGAGLLLAGISLGAGLARVGFGALSDHRRGDPLRAMVVLLCAGAGGYALLAWSEPAAVVAGAVVAGGVGWGWAGLMTLAIVERRRSAPAGAIGIAMAGVYAGAATGPLVIGSIAAAISFSAAWLGAAALVLAAALLVIAARERLAQLPVANAGSDSSV